MVVGGAWELARRTSVAPLCIAASVLMLAGCGEKRRGSASEQEGRKVLTYAIGNEISNMDPAQITDVESALVANQVYEGLVRFKPGSVDIEPALAESFETSPDGLQWTFKLRQDVEFQDGTPFNADAVIFSVLRQMDQNHPYHVAGRMRYAKFLFGDSGTTESELVTDVAAPDQHTVIFSLARPYKPFLKNLAMTPAMIVSPETVKALGKDINTTMVGTGAFRIRTYRRDESVSIERNESYWGEKTKLDEVRFRILRDANVRVNSVRKGDSDIISGIDPTSLPLLEKDKNVQVLSEASMNLGYLSLNNERPPLDNPTVRLALCYAIDRSYLANTLYSGTSVEAKGIIPPGMLGYSPDQEGFPYRVEKAKQLLSEAGFPNGFTLNLSSHDRARIYNPVGGKLAERIQQDLAKVGVTVKIDQTEFSTFLNNVKSGEYQMAINGWVSDNGDPDNFIYELAGREDNEHNYVNPEATRLMREAAMEQDEARRAEMYQRAEDMLAANPPFVVLNHGKQILAVRERVQNFQLHPTGVAPLAAVDVK